jgi:hypothetical protein
MRHRKEAVSPSTPVSTGIRKVFHGGHPKPWEGESTSKITGLLVEMKILPLSLTQSLGRVGVFGITQT